MFETHLWKSDILSKDVGHRPASLIKMALFHRCFPNIVFEKLSHILSYNTWLSYVFNTVVSLGALLFFVAIFFCLCE